MNVTCNFVTKLQKIYCNFVTVTSYNFPSVTCNGNSLRFWQCNCNCNKLQNKCNCYSTGYIKEVPSNNNKTVVLKIAQINELLSGSVKMY